MSGGNIFNDRRVNAGLLNNIPLSTSTPATNSVLSYVNSIWSYVSALTGFTFNNTTMTGTTNITGTTHINTTGTNSTSIGVADGTSTDIEGNVNISTSGTDIVTIGNSTTQTTISGIVGINTSGSGQIATIGATGNTTNLTNVIATFPTIGGTAAQFKGYEERVSVSISFTGAYSHSYNWIFTKTAIGVIVEWPDMNLLTSANTTINAAASSIPTRFLPASRVRMSVIGQDNGTNLASPVDMEIGTDGSISIYKNASSTAFTSGAIAGPYGSHFCYVSATQ